MKYRVTAMLNEKQIIDEVEAVSEEHAWVVASNKHLPERPLYNGKVEELPTRAEQAERIKELEAALDDAITFVKAFQYQTKHDRDGEHECYSCGAQSSSSDSHYTGCEVQAILDRAELAARKVSR